MSFQNLVGSSDGCSGSNPVGQLMRNISQQHHKQTAPLAQPRVRQDHISEAAGPSTRAAPLPASNQVSSEIIIIVVDFIINKFLDDFMLGPSTSGSGSMRHLEQSVHRLNVNPPPMVANALGQDWQKEFNALPDMQRHLSAEERKQLNAIFASSMPPPQNGEVDQRQWIQNFQHQFAPSILPGASVITAEDALFRQFDDAFDGITSNIDWDKEFAAVEASAPSPKQSDQEWSDQFKSTVAESTTNIMESQLGSEFEQVWKSVSESDALDAFQSTPAVLEDDNAMLSGSNRFQNLKYSFEPVNAFLEHADPYAEGLELVRNGGSLSQAALAFEAAVQKDMQNADAWALLGRCQAENEKEDPAIAALQAAIEVAPGHLEALMDLAVSYTNEGCDREAFKILAQWMAHKYPEIAEKSATPDWTMAPINEIYDHTIGLFLETARKTSQSIDADVQVGLGVLFYNSGQYDKAIDCFSTALKVRPKDYLLWNRLGATLANSGRSEEAIDAYYRALAIKPSFTRGRYNLGVGCMNIGCYKEAAEHFLTALYQHQESPEMKNISNNLWETLRRTFIMMERRDLADKAMHGVDVGIYRAEFDF